MVLSQSPTRSILSVPRREAGDGARASLPCTGEEPLTLFPSIGDGHGDRRAKPLPRSSEQSLATLSVHIRSRLLGSSIDTIATLDVPGQARLPLIFAPRFSLATATLALGK